MIALWVMIREIIACTENQVYFRTCDAMKGRPNFTDVGSAIFRGDFPYDRKEPQSIAEN
jgi:hypothetical protein